MRYLDVTLLVSRTGVRMRCATYGEPGYHKYTRAKPARTVQWISKGTRNVCTGTLRRIYDANVHPHDCIDDARSSVHNLHKSGYTNTTLRSAIYAILHERWGMTPDLGQRVRALVRNCRVPVRLPVKSCLRGPTCRTQAEHPPMLLPVGPAAPQPPPVPRQPAAPRRVRFAMQITTHSTTQ